MTRRLVLVFVLILSLSALCQAQAEQGSTAVPEGMVLIPAGSFQMGDAFDESYFAQVELPVHTVYVSAFYMAKYEVTKALWDEVATWASSHGYDIGPSEGYGKASSHPVSLVSWYEAVKWANARSEKEGLTSCYTVGEGVYRTGQSDSVSCNWTASGYRLPTEAEWEKAARGGCAGHRFPWCDADTITHSRANYYSDTYLSYDFSEAYYSYDTSPTCGFHPTYKTGAYQYTSPSGSNLYTSPVGSFGVNGYGICDMAGNVGEWCWDWQESFYYASSPGTDPRGPASGSCRVDRGGGWGSSPYQCRVAARHCNWPDGENDALGLRLVRTAPYGTRASSYTPPAYTPPVYTPPSPPPGTLSTSDMQVWPRYQVVDFWEDYVVLEGTVTVTNLGSIEAENCVCKVELVSDRYIIDSDRKWGYDIRPRYYDWWAFSLAGDVNLSNSYIYVELECDNLEGRVVERDRL